MPALIDFTGMSQAAADLAPKETTFADDLLAIGNTVLKTAVAFAPIASGLAGAYYSGKAQLEAAKAAGSTSPILDSLGAKEQAEKEQMGALAVLGGVLLLAFVVGGR